MLENMHSWVLDFCYIRSGGTWHQADAGRRLAMADKGPGLEGVEEVS